MSSIEKEVDRILTLLRNKIRERGFTQLEVQEKLNWGRSYISQLLTKQKSLRVEQVLLILETIKVDPKEFYAELYQFPRPDFRLRNLDEYADPQIGESLFGPALVPEGESFSMNELTRLVFDPFPARLTVSVDGRVLQSDGWIAESGFFERPAVDAWNALVSLEGRWLSPDLVTALASPAPEDPEQPDATTVTRRTAVRIVDTRRLRSVEPAMGRL